MIEQLTGFAANSIAVVCKGRVTRDDYDTVLVPAVERLLNTHEKVRLYYQVDPDFTGMETGAMWQDFKVGMTHLTRWERVAVVTDVYWMRNTVLAFSFILPGWVKVFSLEQTDAARSWIAEP